MEIKQIIGVIYLDNIPFKKVAELKKLRELLDCQIKGKGKTLILYRTITF